jgi:hypothetical protein
LVAVAEVLVELAVHPARWSEAEFGQDAFERHEGAPASAPVLHSTTRSSA